VRHLFTGAIAVTFLLMPVSAPALPSRQQALTTTARPTPAPVLPRGRPFGLGGVYAALAGVAVLPLAGRVLAFLQTKKDDER
jgi:hypothetical protein